MITLKNITKTYGGAAQVQALKGINLTIDDGEIFGIIGKSGAGKSTLVRCINMLEKPTSGQVIIDDKDLTKMNESQLRAERKNIGMIFQHFNLLSSRTVAENIAFPLELIGASKDVIEKKVASLLDLVGLSDRAGNYPSQLSGGQKQRVGIARALASDPKILLCDEATSALDPQTTKSILELLQDINKRLGITIVVITHEMAVVKEICHRVAVIESGVIKEMGRVVDIFTNPQSQTMKDFVTSIINMELPAGIKNLASPISRRRTATCSSACASKALRPATPSSPTSSANSTSKSASYTATSTTSRMNRSATSSSSSWAIWKHRPRHSRTSKHYRLEVRF